MNFLHCEHISKELLDEIRIKKNVILYNYSEPYSLFPASFPHNPPEVCGFEVDGSRAIFYHLLTEFDDTFDITYVGPDIHLKQNYERVKKAVRYSSLDLKIVSFPWFFVYEYFYFKDRDSYTLKEDIQFSTKYNAIFLSGGKRYCRDYIMAELSKYDNFIFSNMGYLDDDSNRKIHQISPRITDPYKEIFEYELLDDCLSISCYNHMSKEKETLLVAGDQSSLDSVWNFNNFNSWKKIYFKSNLNRYKNPDQVAFDNGYFSRDQQPSISQLEKTYLEKNIPAPHQLCPWYWYNIVPDEYLESAVNFVCESQTDIATHVTEKTVKNFFYKKPFLTFGCKNFYKFLTDHGFVLYDELFDYSFDEIEHYGKRLKAYIIECEKILQMDLNDLTNIINTFKDKLDHNYQICSDLTNKLYSKKFEHCFSTTDSADLLEVFQENQIKDKYQILQDMVISTHNGAE